MLTSSVLLITLCTSVLCVIFTTGHQRLLRHLGPRSLYLLWALVPISYLAIVAGPWLGESLYWVLQKLGLSTAAQALQSYTALWATPIELVSTKDAWMPLISGVWLLGVALMLSLIGLGQWRLQQLPKQNRLGLTVATTAPGTSPGVFGWWRPTLLLPTDFNKRYSTFEQRLILRHELTHWRRHDTQANLIAWLLLSVQWFNPLAWLGYQRFRADQELACDADVLSQHRTSPQHGVGYAHALLKTSTNRAWGGPVVNPCSTHYGYQQGRFNLMKERIQTLQQHQPLRKFPLVLAAVGMVSASMLWHTPAISTPTQAAAAETITPIVRINPRYPEAAAAEGVEGYVEVEFWIGNDGKPVDIKVLKSQPEGVFDDNVIAALQRWRYVPGKTDQPLQLRIDMRLP
ncbi:MULTISPECIES: TonB family protein [Pseudidiomarina]|uniref:Protein TonB n=2 Tax=Pseudidiomarina TaxID=2800384 RepID=A0A368V0H2_9GAMM|nr:MULTISPECIES: M56 family metallopeptidase [Pseudidiomarina]PWW14202.1 outer membrane transport energization protein TonB [Pseudidiomarina maritima]RBP92016.1 outer membrane transport energization protein TonB [Pseudidiomarina tainanensis]RCW33780.1 outer membrane transport energization protein TonB [Pseudidiomarina tainanensis]